MRDGPVALVTGGAHGIGREVVRQLAERGMTVWLSAREGKAEPVAAELARAGLQVRPLELDVTSLESVEAARDVIAAAGGLDVLINNAAAFSDWAETPSKADLDVAAVVLETNLFGPWRVTQALLPLLRASAHPRVVMVSSGGGTHTDATFGLGATGGRSVSYG
ncbi:MAG: SDR family NAD(P)-dependent oxidoreductase, partial [Myxococcota bacterium]